MNLYDLKDLSEKLKVSVRTLRQYIKAGELKASKVGKRYLVTEDSLTAFVESRG